MVKYALHGDMLFLARRLERIGKICVKLAKISPALLPSNTLKAKMYMVDIAIGPEICFENSKRYHCMNTRTARLETYTRYYLAYASTSPTVVNYFGGLIHGETSNM